MSDDRDDPTPMMQDRELQSGVSAGESADPRACAGQGGPRDGTCGPQDTCHSAVCIQGSGRACWPAPGEHKYM